MSAQGLSAWNSRDRSTKLAFPSVTTSSGEQSSWQSNAAISLVVRSVVIAECPPPGPREATYPGSWQTSTTPLESPQTQSCINRSLSRLTASSKRSWRRRNWKKCEIFRAEHSGARRLAREAPLTASHSAHHHLNAGYPHGLRDKEE